MDAIRFRLFPKSPDYKYVPYVIRKRRTSSRLQSTTLGASPPLILGFHPSKRHAALIVPCDQGSIVMLVILMFVAWFLVDSSCLVAYHLRISCCFCAVTFQSYANSCCIELVARRQHAASFPSSRSNLLRFVLILKNWRNIC